MSEAGRPMAAIKLAAIGKSFGDNEILSGIDLSAAQGEFIALVGPSGCGKSTLLRIIAGLDQADNGSVTLDGRDVTALRAADRDMAMVFQSYALYPHLTARQNMMLPLAMRRLSTLQRLPIIGSLIGATRSIVAAMARDVEQAAATLKISALLDRKPAQMSGGQRQRVALGRALVRHPRAFLMDEPLSNLDAALRVHMRAEIVELHRRAGVVTIYVTHDQEEALGMADRIAVMMNGRILQIADPKTIYREPAHIDVACFIGSPRINLIPVIVDDRRLGLCGQHPLIERGCAAPGDEISLGVRPENMQVHVEPGPLSLPIAVTRFEFLGSDALLHARAEGVDSPLIAKLQPAQAALLQDHTILHVSVPRDACLMFGSDGRRIADDHPAAGRMGEPPSYVSHPASFAEASHAA